ncbi:MAG: uroporphyrinogen decarboxylase family protein [Dehalococcoidia bacterium]|jgi:uroporphyrinogen decarboxylase|nr:uroporphyrinogen decarboxylase family protein [Dehalococcoidia bacterium]
MAGQMTHRERTMAALNGQPVDRPPISMWRHFFSEEKTAEELAAAMLGYQQRYDWDYMKVNVRANIHAEAWGLKIRYDGDQPPTVVETPIKEPDDWLRLEVPSLDQGPLAEHLHALELIAGGLGGQVPFLVTAFTPFSNLSRLVPSEDIFLQHVREHFDKVQHALEVAAESTIALGRACLDRGASGLFYATTVWGTADRMPVEEYLRVSRPTDVKVLSALDDAEFNVLHVCRNHNMLSALADYPAQAFNWDARGQGNHSLAEGKTLVGGRTVIGGLQHRDELVGGTPEGLAGTTRELVEAMGNQGWMLGSGCTYSPETPEAHIRAIRQAVEGA